MAFSNLIDVGNAVNWYSTTSWDQRDVFDRYVQSVTQGEFNLTRHTRVGNYIYTRTYLYGRVDFGDVPMHHIDYDKLVTQQPTLLEQMFNAMCTLSGHWNSSEVWLGGFFDEPPVQHR